MSVSHFCHASFIPAAILKRPNTLFLKGFQTCLKSYPQAYPERIQVCMNFMYNSYSSFILNADDVIDNKDDYKDLVDSANVNGKSFMII